MWSRLLWERDMKMGIIDVLPVDHSLRKPVANYSWSEADMQRKELFEKHQHFSYDECFRVLAAVPLDPKQARSPDPAVGFETAYIDGGSAAPPMVA